MRQPEDELSELEEASLLRRIPTQHTGLVDFASNDYLGLSQHPAIKRAYLKGIEKYGTGSGASRLISGTSVAHRKLEETIAHAKSTEAALTFSTGYATSTGVLPALLNQGDTVILDKLCHASLIDGARMSGATLRVFPHNNLSKLEDLLKKTIKKTERDSRVLVITESVFSMDGDTAPLEKITRLCKQNGALLMVDEAHALGVFGDTGMGLAEQLGLHNAIDLHMGTLGKAAGVAGGYIAANQKWIDLILNKARSFIYSTAPPPAQAAAATEALGLIQSEEGAQLRKKLWCNIHALKKDSQSAIIPWIIGDNTAAIHKSNELCDAGFNIPAIRYPTVPRNTARLRITINTRQTSENIAALKKLL
ncbi:MAG: aminotransferase class I/II-fold pyridoxal phosphate-dependent enzyme [Akkermansiaceae bacterium]